MVTVELVPVLVLVDCRIPCRIAIQLWVVTIDKCLWVTDVDESSSSRSKTVQV